MNKKTTGTRNSVLPGTIAEKQSVICSIEDWICNIALILLALVPALDYLLSITIHRGIPSSSELVPQLLLIAGLVSGMITTRKQEHLAIGLIHYIKHEKVLKVLKIISASLSSSIAILLSFASLAYIKTALSPPWMLWFGEEAQSAQMIAFLPAWAFALFLPLAFFVIALRFTRLIPLPEKIKPLSFIPVIFGVFCAVPVILKFIWGLNLPPAAFDISDWYIGIADFIKIPAIIFLVVMAFGGTPLFIVFAGVAMLLFEAEAWEIDTIITDVNFTLTKSDFIAIPLFTLTGFFLSESKAGERLVNAFKSFFGWFPGGVVIATVVLCAFFTTFTGASGVTILALGGILYTVLSENAQYSPGFSTGLITSSGSIGLLFPPSLPLILVGVTIQQSILELFAAGFIPGLILSCAMILFGIIVSIKTKVPLEKFNIRKALRSLKASFFEILLPIMLLYGYIGLGLSLVQISAIALVYIFFIEVFITREIPLKNVPRVFIKAIPIIGGILSIIALSKGLSDYVVYTQAPENFAHWLQTAVSSKIVFLLILNLALIFVGCFMDIFSAIVVVLPLIIPLGQVYDINPLHLGIIFLINLEAGFLTPPVGLNLFLASYRFKKPFVEICKYVFPFLLIQLAVVFLVTYVDDLSLFLPALLNSK
ncbi:MAG: TRAP transporter large permease subunit [Spirochaetaceae bacterium]|nr:TRAP transporter large permease subunit [Spirochaetaceae bacterium]